MEIQKILLSEFIELNDLPPGPILLKDLGIEKNQLFSSGHLDHKIHEISDILNTYPHLPFILVGDSGQQDPVIYQKIVKIFQIEYWLFI